jgi:hypothetical protein
LAVNDVLVKGSNGTAITWAPAATNSGLWSGWKSPDSEFSPRWMPLPGPGNYQSQGIYQTYANWYNSCATDFVNGGFNIASPPAGCNITPLGTPWDDGTGTLTNLALGGIAGTSRNVNGTVQTMTAAGLDIYNNTDEGLFSYASITGDGAATVKVLSLSPNNPPTDAFAKAGLMFRSSVNANAPHVMTSFTPSGDQFQYRQDAGAITTSSTPVAASAPSWLRLIRSGSTFVGFKSTDLLTWTQIAAPVTVSNLSASSLLLGLAVTSHKQFVNTTAMLDRFAWTPYTNQTLVDADIGVTNTNNAGSRTEVGKLETVVGAGADIYNNSDAFHYAFTSRTGDFEAYVKVTDLVVTHEYAKAGIMIRSNAAADATNAMIEITGTHGSSFQSRVTPAGVTSQLPGVGVIPKWVRITRTGNNFKGFVGDDPASGVWTQVGALAGVTIASFPARALVGLAVTSHVDGTKTTAKFSDFTIASP